MPTQKKTKASGATETKPPAVATVDDTAKPEEAIVTEEQPNDAPAKPEEASVTAAPKEDATEPEEVIVTEAKKKNKKDKKGKKGKKK